MQNDVKINIGAVEPEFWRFTSDGSAAAASTTVMSFGFCGLKAMGLDKFAEVLTTASAGASS